MQTVRRLLVACALSSVLAHAAAAQEIDCRKHVQTAQGAIDKVTDDLKGMEQMMQKEQLVYVHALVDDAKTYLESARHECESPAADYARARAIAKAEAARGSAEAADILHWHFMTAVPGPKPATTMPGMSMPGMKK